MRRALWLLAAALPLAAQPKLLINAKTDTRSAASGLEQVFKANAIQLVGADGWSSFGHRAGSTDMGDLGLIMPIVHPFVGGARGNLHGADFEIVDREAFYLNPAKAIAMTLVDLLFDNAAVARNAIAQSHPAFTKDSYLELRRGLTGVARFGPESP